MRAGCTLDGMQLPKNLSCIDKLILTFISSAGDGEYSVTFLSRILSISRKSAHISLNRLISKGYLQVEEISSGRRPTAYSINPEIAKELCNK